ncbi:helix-turn-helix domain-containing protein [Tepidimicrobium xylanilyticum]|uniref:Transcriptional regulator, XRE family with cupin sensor n=1 Tax=Tepidimicrobium xylanilyticum TaxID=1123352 RepID=A0A1H3ECS7_9FIRM|nr:XRE family transcriptional regulator [Tepidimicrobium xylanilyticum]GMG96582.1 DNA-binding protein [Tepidimicrobium xylanilyticum]SDX76562.1 transcriptional regulator, XRE family with cupin sensor [Tepidimicrobium xylanilyticum]
MSIGAKIREIRQKEKLTLNELAEETGLTASYISQVERGLIEPSISSLRRIAAALCVPLYVFLTEEQEQHVLIRANERRKLELPHSNITYEFVTPMGADKKVKSKMEIIYLRLKGKSWSSDKPFVHPADECIFLIEGVMEVELGTEKYTLYEGDSIYIQENIPHRFYNPSDKMAIGISVISPCIY